MSPVVMYYLETSRYFWEALPPQGPRRRDNRRSGDGRMEEDHLKDAFFSSDAFVCLPRGQKRKKKKKKSPVTRVTCNQYTTPDNCALLVIGHSLFCLFVRNHLLHAHCSFAFFV